MTPHGQHNLITWVAARSDFPDYSRLVAFKLPTERLVYGPMQVEALIQQNTEISDSSHSGTSAACGLSGATCW